MVLHLFSLCRRNPTFRLGLKRKFAFYYFRGNFFFAFRKKAYEKLLKISRKFSHICVCKSFCDIFPFGMRIRIQDPPECVSRSETLVENIREPSREQIFFTKTLAKTFAKTKICAQTFAKTTIFAKRNFAKSERSFAYFRFW
jgi:hypothetical protein